MLLRQRLKQSVRWRVHEQGGSIPTSIRAALTRTRIKGKSNAYELHTECVDLMGCLICLDRTIRFRRLCRLTRGLAERLRCETDYAVRLLEMEEGDSRPPNIRHPGMTANESPYKPSQKLEMPSTSSRFRFLLSTSRSDCARASRFMNLPRSGLAV